MGSQLKQEAKTETEIKGPLSEDIIHRITLQYKFKRATLRNTFTNKLDQGMLFLLYVLYNYPIDSCCMVSNQ